MARIGAFEPGTAVVRGFDATVFDERVLEYPLVLEWLLGLSSGRDLLDVGCVMNNALVDRSLSAHVRNVWFCNVATERVQIQNPVFYHLAPLGEAFPFGPRFHAITCLSTIEHIGFDNRHYGVDLPAKFTSPTAVPLVESLRSLGSLLEEDGALFVSVPFGRREVVCHPRTGRASMQVFDADAIELGVAALAQVGVECVADVWESRDTGWHVIEARSCVRRYADGVPAAAAVAILRGVRRRAAP